MMKICSLASSSSGNCIYIGSEKTNILIDIGINGKRLKTGLELIGLAPEKIDAILLTHEHTDHVSGLGVISRKYRIPVFTTARTWKRIMDAGLLGNIDENLFHPIRPDHDFKIGDMQVHPFRTSHDAVDPVCYTISDGKKKISVTTDLGCYDSYLVGKLKDSNVLFIEANHDVDMLKNGSYPHFLKKRILGDRGHLSNTASARLIAELFGKNLEYVLLGHLSRENNRPELAHESVRAELIAATAFCLAEDRLIVCEREALTRLITI